MNLSVPYYSQYRDVSNKEWQPRACGGACLKMTLDFVAKKYQATIPSLDELLEEGKAIKAYTPGQGWVHRGMVFLAHNHGVPAYQEEFRSLDGTLAPQLVSYGFEKIIETMENGLPVIVSIKKGFEPDGGHHQIVLVGYEGDSFFYHEPEAKDDSGLNRKVSKDTFLSCWRQFAIFVG